MSFQFAKAYIEGSAPHITGRRVKIFSSPKAFCEPPTSLLRRMARNFSMSHDLCIGQHISFISHSFIVLYNSLMPACPVNDVATYCSHFAPYYVLPQSSASTFQEVERYIFELFSIMWFQYVCNPGPTDVAGELCGILYTFLALSQHVVIIALWA